MRPSIPWIALVLVVSLVVVGGAAVTTRAGLPSAPGLSSGQVVPGRYIVVLRDDVPGAAAVARDLALRLGLAVSHVYEHALKGFAADVPAGRLTALQQDPRVAFVEADQTVQIFAQEVPTGIRRLFADGNAQIQIDGTDDYRVDVDVAVIDTGIDYTHTDLNVVARTDCSGGGPFKQSCADGTGFDGNGHGTHVAGTIGALDNAIGVVGVAPGARLWSVKVLGDNGSGYISWIVAGVDWVTAHAAQIEVANMSLGCECSSAALDQAISSSVAAGIVYVVAAGNNDKDASTFSPANHPDVITVSALADFDGAPGGGAAATCRADLDDTLADFSNWGSKVEVAAPGVCILSTWTGGGYNTISGTSMASPHVAGAAALLASGSNKPMNKADVLAIRQAIIASGNFDWTDDSGDGIKEPLLDVSNAAVFAPFMMAGPGAGGDTPPSVAISSPSGGTVANTVTVTASASDDQGVTSVEFLANGVSIGTDTDGSDGWSVAWDTQTAPDGDYALTAVATDTAAQQTTSAPVTVTVFNGTGSSANSMGVFAISWAARRHLDVTVNIRRDSAIPSGLDDTDAPVAGATVSFSLTRTEGGSWTFTGNTDSLGNFRGRLINAPSGHYQAAVTSVTHPTYTWVPSLDVENTDSFTK